MLRLSDITEDAVRIIASNLLYTSQISMYNSSDGFRQLMCEVISPISEVSDFVRCCEKGEVLSLLYDGVHGQGHICRRAGFDTALETAFKSNDLHFLQFLLLYSEKYYGTSNGAEVGNYKVPIKFFKKYLSMAFAYSSLEIVNYVLKEAKKTFSASVFARFIHATLSRYFNVACCLSNILLLSEILKEERWPFKIQFSLKILERGLRTSCEKRDIGTINVIATAIPQRSLPSFYRKILLYSVKCGNSSLVAYAVNKGAVIGNGALRDIDITKYRSIVVLMELITELPQFAPIVLVKAAPMRNATIIKQLMERGGRDPTCSWCFSDRELMRALETACATRRSRLEDANIQYLLTLGISNYDSAFVMACISLNTSIAEYFMTVGVSLYSRALEIMCSNVGSKEESSKSLSLMEKILDRAPSDVYFNEALAVATEHKYTAARNLILNKGRLL